MSHLDALHWDMFLRGAVAALLALHLVQLALPGPRPQARLALAGFVASVAAYLLCQQADRLLSLPRPLAYAVLALCVGSPAWLWLAARALFDDHFVFTPLLSGAVAGLVGVGLAANLPYFPAGDGPYLQLAPDSWVVHLGLWHAGLSVAFTAAALWEVLHDAQADLVAARRAARRWTALGIGLYAAVALAVDLAVRGRDVGPWLPALHVAGIGLLALLLAVWVSRHSLAEVLGAVQPGLPAAPDLAAEPAPAPVRVVRPTGEPSDDVPPDVPPDVRPDARSAGALQRLDHAMTVDRLYRREGLSLKALADTLGVTEAGLRELINQRLGFRNFNDFLHHHRLQEAAPRLTQEDLPILSIALDCGYGSIGPFNRAFKQRLGLTPTDYRAAARRPSAGHSGQQPVAVLHQREGAADGR
jgi:AraC-like DNA-binding protein